MRRLLLTSVVACLSSLVLAAGAAQAMVVNADNGQQTQSYGVAMLPGTQSTLQGAGIPVVNTSGSCLDPALPVNPFPIVGGLCWNGGPVMHSNQSFVLTWDPVRRYWQTTQNYVEQFLRDVADGSGSLSSPYALSTQYWDGPFSGDRAANQSNFGGGCVDWGTSAGSACQWGNISGNGPGHGYDTFPGPSCSATGTNNFHEFPDGSWGSAPNDLCLTDVQIRSELATMIAQTGVAGRVTPGYSPMFVVLLPPGVVSCIDGAGKLCSANGGSQAQFCSYHADMTVPGFSQPVSYVVQPWTALTGCDDPDAPKIPDNPPAITFAQDVGARLVNPLSQASLAAITNPQFNGWFAQSGAEMNDNGCVPLGNGLDTEIVGHNTYYLQREFNNAGSMVTDPNVLACAPNVGLQPAFVVPSPVQPGDEVWLDGSPTVSTLLIPGVQYVWNFGDGTPTAVGPSVVHDFTKPGTYTVTLTVVDRGHNSAQLSQSLQILGAGGQAVPATPSGPIAHLLLMPQALRAVLHNGLSLRVTSSTPADGIVSVWISRATAKRAHISAGRAGSVVVGRGTIANLIKDGTVQVHIKLPKSVATKLSHLRHVTLTVRLALVAAGGQRFSTVVAGTF